MREKKLMTLLLAVTMAATSIPSTAAYATPSEAVVTEAVEDSEERETLTTTLDGKEITLPVYHVSKYGYIDSDIEFHNPKNAPEEFQTGAERVSYYNLRDLGYVTPARDQSCYGTCWAFGATGAVESGMLKRNQTQESADEFDLSDTATAFFGFGKVFDPMHNLREDGMVYQMTDEGRDKVRHELADKYKVEEEDVVLNDYPEIGYLNHGGGIISAVASLAHQYGVIDELKAPYPNGDGINNRLKAITVTSALNGEDHFQSDRLGYLTETRVVKMTNPELVKQSLIAYGAASVGYMAENEYCSKFDDGEMDLSNYCNMDDTTGDHIVVLVGWDDNYSKEHFNGKSQPTRDGAWILKNSWGTSDDENHPWDGFFHISYEDTSIAVDQATFFEVNTENPAPDHVYQYDDSNLIKNKDISAPAYYEANVYTVSEDAACSQSLREVSFMTDADTEYEIKVYQSPELVNGVVENPRTGTLIGKTSGTEVFAGYHTAEISCEKNLEPGDRYSVVIYKKQEAESESQIYVEESSVQEGELYLDEGEKDSWAAADYLGKLYDFAEVQRGQSMYSTDGSDFSDMVDWQTDEHLGNIILHASTDDVRTLSVSEDTVDISVGSLCRQEVKVESGDDTDQFSYSSSDTDVASVDASGYVYGLHAGKAMITAKADDGASVSYEVVVYADIMKCSIEEIKAQQYTGRAVIPEVEVKWQREILKQDEDYVVTARNNVNVGTATATISGIGLYEGQVEQDFSISNNELDIAFDNGTSYPYTGQDICPDIHVTCKDGFLTEDDYTVTYRNNKEVGTAWLTVREDESGLTLTRKFTITSCPLNTLFTYNIKDQKLEDGAVEPEVYLYNNNQRLTKNEDYTVSYYNNTAVRRAYGIGADPKAVVTGIGNYAGVRELRFSIVGDCTQGSISLEKARVSNVVNAFYSGEAVEQQPKVVLNGNTLKEGTDYYLTYQDEKNSDNHTDAGKITMTVNGMGSYKDSVEKTFTIKAVPLNSDYVDITLKKYCYQYTGSRIAPLIQVKTKTGSEISTDDYTVTITGKGKVGTTKAVIKAKKEEDGGSGNFTGSKTVKFLITKGNMELLPLSVSVDYPGQAVTLKTLEQKLGAPLSLTDEAGNTYTNGRDWRITLQENKKAGEAVVVLTGLRNNKGKMGCTIFTIHPATPEMLTWSTIKPVSYKGKAVYPRPVIKNGRKKLVNGKDYKLYYFNNNEKGTGTVSVALMGNYAGNKDLTFTIQ